MTNKKMIISVKQYVVGIKFVQHIAVSKSRLFLPLRKKCDVNVCKSQDKKDY